jgi:mannose-6-phosphate isomerase
VPDFALRIVDLAPPRDRVTVDDRDALVVLCTSGRAHVQVADATVELRPGHAAFVPARAGAVTLSGAGQVTCASVGRPAGGATTSP